MAAEAKQAFALHDLLQLNQSQLKTLLKDPRYELTVVINRSQTVKVRRNENKRRGLQTVESPKKYVTKKKPTSLVELLFSVARSHLSCLNLEV